MSLSESISVNCPFCSAPNNFKIHRTINVTVDPHLKPAVLSGKINSNVCSTCNEEVQVETGFIYHDMKPQVMITLKMTNEEEEGFKDIVDGLVDKGYIYREVYSYPELMEKIAIFDSQLNDHVVEQIRSRLEGIMDESLTVLKDVDPDMKFSVYFKGIKNKLFKKELLFYCFTHPSQVMEVNYAFKNLTQEEKTEIFNMNALRKM